MTTKAILAVWLKVILSVISRAVNVTVSGLRLLTVNTTALFATFATPLVGVIALLPALAVNVTVLPAMILSLASSNCTNNTPLLVALSAVRCLPLSSTLVGANGKDP
ncbi:MAG: hypothetical protein U1F68_19075 [Gammaproteobacteria bacterium]